MSRCLACALAGSADAVIGDEASLRHLASTRRTSLHLPIGSDDWLWIDDELQHAERAILESNDAMNRFIQINIDQNPSALIELPSNLQPDKG